MDVVSPGAKVLISSRCDELKNPRSRGCCRPPNVPLIAPLLWEGLRHISAVAPTFRKPGYSQDFYNWSKGDYEYHPVTDHVVGAEHNPYTNWLGNYNHVPSGWLHSVGAVRARTCPWAPS